MKLLIRNLLFLGGVWLVLFLMYPDMMEQIAQLFKGLFGPLAILLIIAAALPRRRR